jgi:hypothetical protein
MTTVLHGVLTIKSIPSSKGSFSVGDLATGIGTFKVKDALIDQYEPGRYTGNFVISEIYPTSYTWRGKVWVEVRARLAEIILDAADVESEEALAATPVPTSDPDPIEESTLTPPAAPIDASSTTVPASGQDGEAVGDPDLELFGVDVLALVQAGSPVKLDPTVDRAVFRQQRDRLKALGFSFHAQSQTWLKP